MTSYLTSADGTSIAYDRIGTGAQPVIFVAAAVVHRAIDSETPQLAELLGDYTTWYIADRRGRGESGDTLPYSIDREIEDIRALIELAGGSAALFGYSSGAVLALDAAARDIGVTKVAIYEPPLQRDDGARPNDDPYLTELRGILASGDRAAAVARFARMTGMPDEAIEGMRQSPGWPAMLSIAPTLAYDGEIIADAESQNWAEHWAGVTVPTLIIDGDASFPFMATAANRVAETLPDARRATLAGQTHQLNPEMLAPVLRQFLLS
jgi:pimeloyl-ACP methyl ester carboxylesterase